MHVDDRTLDLFAPFAREVGNPQRTRIFKQKQFEDFVLLNNGASRDVFTSVYPSDHTIDKLFFDFDCSRTKYPDITMQEVFNDFCKFYGYLVDIGEVPLPVVTGSKGYHLYVPLYSSKATKEQLWLATLSLLYESGLIWLDVDDKGKNVWKSSRAIDTTTIGDIEQLCRIPNTLRAPSNEYWCTWLPLYKHDIRDMSVDETFEWAKRYHLRDDVCERKHTLDYFITRDTDFFEGFKGNFPIHHQMADLSALSEKEDMLYSMLKPYIPRGVISRVIHPEADHESRFVTALAMLESGLPIDFVVNLLSLIGWSDWDISVCRSQVQQIDKNRGLRYSYGGNYGATMLTGKSGRS